jgi:glycosyltransferase involved in cell wall biosynthesis
MNRESQHTFVVCAYGESPYLKECVQSLMAQTVKSQILIATSTPNDLIQGVANEFSLPVYVNEGEKGITGDWNFAMSCADTKYVTIAHQDDLYESTYLEKILAKAEKSKRPIVIFSEYYEIRNGERVEKNRLLQIKRLMLLPIRLPMAEKSRWIRRRILSFGSPICCPSVTYAKENLPYAVFQHGFRACEDWQAWEMISRLKGDFLYSPKALMGHRIHEGSETSAIIEDHGRTEEEYIMYRKFWPDKIARVLNRAYSSAQGSNHLE